MRGMRAEVAAKTTEMLLSDYRHINSVICDLEEELATFKTDRAIIMQELESRGAAPKGSYHQG